ncbi:MAG: hypothetical protein JWN52_6608 [Actinomycetia bacterium]|nr:hypothetical protein [Actinomycetes bacterium]
MARNQASTYAKPADLYAAHRCDCNHIVYEDDQPGGRCRWQYVGAGCECTDHRVAGGESS